MLPGVPVLGRNFVPLKRRQFPVGPPSPLRAGSKVSDPSASVLDTGEKLTPKTMTGAELVAAKLDAGEPVDPAAQVVVISFSPVKAGQNIRVRISET
jgi:hypothetical protein